MWRRAKVGDGDQPGQRNISYRYVSLLTHYYLMLFIHSCYSLFIVTIVRFDEFDEAIEEAIEEDIKEAEGGGRGAFSYITLVLIFELGYGSLDWSMMSIHRSRPGEGHGEHHRPQREGHVHHPTRGWKGERAAAANQFTSEEERRRLNDLDSDSTVDEEESEDEFRLSDR